MNENKKKIRITEYSCFVIFSTVVFALGCLCGSVIGGMAALYFATTH